MPTKKSPKSSTPREKPIHFDNAEQAGSVAGGSAQQMRGGLAAQAGGRSPSAEELDARDQRLGAPRKAMGPMAEPPSVAAALAAADDVETEDVPPTDPIDA